MTNNDRPAEASGDEGRTAPATPWMGTLVIQTWHEAALAPGFRARITYRKQDEGEAASSYFSDPADVLKAVGEWLNGPSGQARQV